MDEYKNNYMFHTLNMKEIYMQYVACYKDCTLAKNSKIYSKQLQSLLTQASHYMKDYVTFQGKF